MNGDVGDVRPMGLLRRALWLAVAMMATLAAAAPVGWCLDDGDGCLAAVIAAGVCLGAGVLGLLAGAGVSVTSQSPLGMVAGMLVRMAIPLAACLVFQLRVPVLAKVGIVFYVLAFYAVMLTLETILAVRDLTSASAKKL